MSLQRNILITTFLLTGCGTQTTEYRTSPSWQTALSGGNSVDHVRDDGTVVKFNSSNESSSHTIKEYLNTIELQEKDEITGELTVRSILPEHVLNHTLTCLRDRNWDVLYEQIISAKSRQYYSQLENGREEFDMFFITNRRELARTLQRIHGGKGFGDMVASENGNTIIYELSARVASGYKFKAVTFVREDQFLKLDSIR
ncbi:MAG: hypothetical protein ISR75_00625 [Phycisphaerales bacterium]|nr:hypothetical protein [Planctomycetota bacterium]MBL6996926.1 hypothetical protein [Phycisphaerales bacterium]